MLVALTTGQKLGILLVAAAFVAFALASSFLLPRRNPNFPGRRLPLFVVASVLFFAGTMTAMITLAREDEAEVHAAENGTETGGEAAETEPSGTETGETATGETAEGEGETGTAGEGAAQGDAEAGRELFASQGCGGCHALAAADASASVGPNLDEAQPGFEEAVAQIANGGGGMPPYQGRLSDEEIRNVAAFVVDAAGS